MYFFAPICLGCHHRLVGYRKVKKAVTLCFFVDVLGFFELPIPLGRHFNWIPSWSLLRPHLGKRKIGNRNKRYRIWVVMGVMDVIIKRIFYRSQTPHNLPTRSLCLLISTLLVFSCIHPPINRIRPCMHASFYPPTHTYPPTEQSIGLPAHTTICLLLPRSECDVSLGLRNSLVD